MIIGYAGSSAILNESQCVSGHLVGLGGVGWKCSTLMK